MNLTASLGKIPSLSKLTLSGVREVKSLEFLGKLSDLAWIELSRLPDLSDMNTAGYLTKLQKFTIDRCPVVDLPDFPDSLEELTLSNLPDIKELTKLRDKPQIKFLVLRLCHQISEIDPVGTLKALSSIEIAGLPMRSLDPLENNVSLTRITLVDCRNLEDLTALSGLANVENVTLLACPKISDLTPLASIKGLKELTIGGCDNITTLAPLAGQTSLKKVALGEPDSRRLQIPESLLPIVDPDHMLYRPDHMLYRLGMVRDMNDEYRTMRYVYSAHRPWFLIQHVDPFDDEFIEVVYE
jgi:internalin A